MLEAGSILEEAGRKVAIADPDAFVRDNLERLVEQLQRTPGAPKLRYITMAFRSNLSEIPSLVKWMNESGNAWEIEVRHVFNTANIPEEFRREHFLHAGDWERLLEVIDALGYDNCVFPPPPAESYEETEREMPGNWFDSYKHPADAPPLPKPSFNRPLKLRARSIAIRSAGPSTTHTRSCSRASLSQIRHRGESDNP